MTAQNNDRCLNCGSPLDGPYCSQCGQAKSARMVPLKEWAGDCIETCFSLDSKLLRTLQRVFFQPGQATLDFAGGRRVAYSGPARVYIIVSAISIAAMTLRGAFAAESGLVIPGSEPDEEFQKRVQFLFPFVNLLSPVLTAGILSVLQRKQFFQLHLVFSLHYWTFLIGVSTPLIFLPLASVWPVIAFAGLSLVSVGYIYIAHRRVFPVSLLRRLVACAAILFSIPLATVLFTALLYVLASIV